MPAENGNPDPAPATGQGQQGTNDAGGGTNDAGGSQQQASQQQQQQQTDDDKLGDAGKRALDQERQARRDADKALKDVQAELKKLQEAGQSDLEKAQNKAAEAEKELAARDARISELTVSQAVEKEALKQGALYPDAVARLAPRLELDSDGNPKDVAKTVTELRKDYPQMFSSGGGNGTVPGGARPPAGSGGEDMNDRIRRAAGRA